MSRSDLAEVRVALVGVGNCSSALVQGLRYYQADFGQEKSSAVKRTLAGIKIAQIRIVCAFDVDAGKVGRELASAIFVPPNCATRITPMDPYQVIVECGVALDADVLLPKKLASRAKHVSVRQIREVLKGSRAEVLVNLLPSGSVRSTAAYVEAAIEERLAIVNAIPVAVANDTSVLRRAIKAGVPVIGDDIKSQFGATVLHKTLMELFQVRGCSLEHTIQLDWGGDADFENLVCFGQYKKGKAASKTHALRKATPAHSHDRIHITAVDHIAFLGNRKEAFFRLQGTIFGEQEMRLEMTLTVQDAFNSAGVLVDAIRVAKWAKDRRRGGLIREAAAVFCKWHPYQCNEFQAFKSLQRLLKTR